jgi:hypothetical protein
MDDLPIGSLWRSRLNADIRLILEVCDVFDDSSVFMITYHAPAQGYTANTLASVGEWKYEWVLTST